MIFIEFFWELVEYIYFEVIDLLLILVKIVVNFRGIRIFFCVGECVMLIIGIGKFLNFK